MFGFALERGLKDSGLMGCWILQVSHGDGVLQTVFDYKGISHVEL